MREIEMNANIVAQCTITIFGEMMKGVFHNWMRIENK